MPRHGYIPLIYFLLIIGINCNFPITTNHIPTTTTETLNFGKSCSSSNDCPGKGEYCTSFKICLCLETFVDIDNKCHPKVFPGSGPCYHDAQCSNSFPGSFCSGDNVCLCPHGLILKGNSCIQATIPPLIQSDNSSPNNYKSIARASLFDKLSTYISKKRKQLFDEDTLIANTIPDIAPGEFCNTDSACSGYPLSYCEDTCKCREGTFNAGTTCITSNPVPLSIKGNCATNEVYSEEGGLCLSKQSPGQPCQYSEQCSITISGAFCLNRKCACPLGWVASADGKTCNFKDTQCQAKGFIWVEELGECKEVILPGSGTCSHSLQCSAAFGGAVCFQKVCKCPTLTPVPADGTCGITCTTGGESFSSIVGSCLPNVEPGNECVYTSQCHAPHPGTICSMGRCKCARSQVFTGTMCADVCPSGFRIGNFNVCQASCNANQIEHNGNCLDFAAPGQNCEVNAQCTSSSLCATWNDAGISGSRCTCPSNMKIDSGICVIIKAQPGASCLLGEMCTGGSYCTSGICACNTGTVQVNSQCITPISDSACTTSTICTGGSICSNGMCTCTPPLVAIDELCSYPPSVLPNDPCPTGLENCLGGSICQAAICTCQAGSVAEAGQCRVISQVQAGQACSSSRICMGQAVCVRNICTCIAPYYQKNGDCIVAGKTLAGLSCANGESCPVNAFCHATTKICNCIPPTTNTNGICTIGTQASPGDGCRGNVICGGLSNCINDVCTCATGTVNFNGVCTQIVSNLGSCTSSDQCPSNSYCDVSSRVCVCPSNLIAVGRQCYSPFGANSNANTRRRMATYKMVKSSPVNLTTLNVGPGSSCLSNAVRCGNGSQCTSGTCQCNGESHLVNGRCVKQSFALPGESCAMGQECSRQSVCSHQTQRCECILATKIAIGRTCVDRLRSHPGFPCGGGEGGSQCHKSTCKCPGNQIAIDKQCTEAKRLLPGSNCKEEDICTGGSECSNQGKCECRQNQVIVQSMCTRIILSKPTEKCDGPQYRCIQNSYCQDGETCVCLAGMKLYHGQCKAVSRKSPGLGCSEFDECTNHSYCSGGFCHCTAPRILKNGRCEFAVEVSAGNQCRADDICLGGSNCLGGRCLCNEKTEVVRGGVCVEKIYKTPGQMCSESEICDGNSYCGRSKICVCYKNFIVESGKCVKKSRSNPGESCANGERCDGSSYCFKDMCICPRNHIKRDFTCIPLQEVKIGESCSNGQSCLAGSKCSPISKICACPPGFVNRHDSCVPIEVNPGLPCQHGETCLGRSSCKGGICTCPPSLPQTIDFVCSGPGNSVCVTYCICPGGENIIEGVCLPKESIANPGESCEINLTQCSSNSQCIDKICTCNGGYVNINNECVVSFLTTKWPCSNCHNLPNLGESCTINTGCGYGGVCLSPGICQCLPNSSIQNGYCVPNGGGTALPGQVCSNSVMCSGGSVCALNNICVCPFGSFPVNNECVRGQTTGRPGYTEINPGSRCGQPFTICVGGSLCRGDGGSGGICECDNGYTPINNICSLIATTSIPDNYRPLFPGESCGLAFTYCVGGSFCDLNVERCICPVGQTPSGMLCVNSFQTTTNPSTLSILPGQSCDALCELLGTCERYCGGNSLCVGGICTCPMNQQNVNGRCQPFTNYGPGVDLVDSEAPWTNQLRLPGQACNTYSTCIGGSTCVGESCQCPSGFVPTNDKKSCINLEYLNRISNKPNLSANDGDQKKAFRFSKRKATCTDNDQCQGGMVCSQGGTCTCPQSLTNYNGQCLDLFKNKLAYPGSKCIPDDNIDGQKLICTNGSECEEGFCLCPVGTLTALTGFCMPIPEVDTKLPLPGEICGERNNHSCVNNAHCNNGYCLCPYGTKNNGNGLCSHRNTLPETEILKVFTRNLIQSSCTQTSDCIFPGECIQHKCSCPLEMEVTSQKTCKNKIRHSRIGEFCDEVAGLFCTFESFCINHYCSCLNGFVPIRLDGHLECKSVNYTKSETVRRIVQPTPSYTQQRRAQNNGHSSYSQQSRVDHTRESVSNNHQRKAETNQEPPPSYNQQKSTPQSKQPYNNDINEAFVLQTVPDALSDCPLDGSCALPDCFCSRTGKEVPGRIPPANTPQMVILTFDGPVNDRVTNIYKSILSGKHVNPNGCPIKATFFVSHEWSNYDQIEWLYSAGHEIAINSITHRTLTQSNEVEWKQEMDGMRAALSKFSFIDKSKVIGIRAPQLAMGGNAQFGMMAANSFLYDNTQGTVGGPFWPQSLKFKTPWPCIGQSCPNTSHEVWEFPLDMIVGSDGRPNVLIRQAVTRYDSPQKVADMIMANFNRSAVNNRAPFILNIDADFLNQIPYEGGSKAIDLFIEKVLELNEVFLVTMEQALNWIQQPTPLNKLRNFRGWQCQFGGNGGGLPCENPSTCTYSGDNRIKAPHSFRVCGTCPRIYPWIDDPTGKGS